MRPPPPNLSNSQKPSDRVRGAEDTALCLPAEAVWEFRRRPRCRELPRCIGIALPTDGEWARPATIHTLALTGTTVALVLAKKMAKLGPLVCRNDSRCLRKGGG